MRTSPIDDSGRRPMAAGHALLAMLLALAIGALLNASSLREAAEAQPFGWRRTVAVALVRPVDGLSGLLRLDRPRAAIDTALGRERVVRGVAPARRSTRVTTPAADVGTATPSANPSAPASTAGPRQVGPGDPLRVLVVGDSLTETMGPALAEILAPVADVTHDFRYSTGLSRPDFFDWPRYLTELLETRDPDAAVVMFGGNDGQDIRTVDGVVRLGTPEWTAEYGRRVGAVMDQLRDEGRTLVWVGMPVMRSRSFDATARLLNAVYQAQAAERDGVVFLDTRTMFATSEGTYADYLPDPSGTVQLMRRGDGIHLSPAGGDVLARAVAEWLADQWDLSTAAGAS